MKYYFRFPDRALGGMAALTPGQRGIYNSVIDLLYARDGIVPCTTDQHDRDIAHDISVDVRTWRSFKGQLLARGKIWITTDGFLDANGCKEGRFAAETHSETQRKRASIRWENYRLAKKLNGRAMPKPALPIHRDIDNSEYSSSQSMQRDQDVDEGENFGARRAGSTWGSGELEAIIQAKGWKP